MIYKNVIIHYSSIFFYKKMNPWINSNKHVSFTFGTEASLLINVYSLTRCSFFIFRQHSVLRTCYIYSSLIFITNDESLSVRFIFNNHYIKENFSLQLRTKYCFITNILSFCFASCIAYFGQVLINKHPPSYF
jgi:hypothetical protein